MTHHRLRNILTLCRIAVAITAVLCLISLVAPTSRWKVTTTPKYTAREIYLPGADNSTAYSINDRGEALGIAWNDDEDSPFQPFVWKDGKATPLPVPPDSDRAVALDINNGGAITGAALMKNGDIRGVLWQGNRITTFGVRGRDILPRSINDAGVIAGSQSPQESDDLPTAFLWSRNGFKEISEFHQAAQINAAGEIAGIKVTETRDDFFLNAVAWAPEKGVKVLAKPGGYDHAVALGLNDGKQIVGGALKDDGMPAAVCWDAGKPRLLSTKPSVAYSVNDKSQAVGVALRDRYIEAYLWNGSKEVPLNDALGGGKDWILMSATGINEPGQIVGTGLHDGNIRGYVLTPDR